MEPGADAGKGADFYGQVSASKWLSHLSKVLQGAQQIAQSIELGHPCVVHCSDGWDRTSQISR